MSMRTELWTGLDRDAINEHLSELIGYDELFRQELAIIESKDAAAQYEVAAREDLRDIPTYTIDPADARDHDDAISVIREYEDGELAGYTAHVHIADVPYYVDPESMMDEAARIRGFTYYDVEETEHMLPEELVKKASLLEDQDRLANTFEFRFDADGMFEDYDLYRSVINTDRNLSYEQAGMYTKLPNNDPALGRSGQQVVTDIEDLSFLSLRMAQNGDRASIGRDSQYRIVEEFMIRANEIGARELEDRGNGVFRVHDPTRDVDPTASITGHARYDVECGPHDGLGLDEYAHVTSPLRRYGDLVNGRILWEDAAYPDTSLIEIADHLTQMERVNEARILEEYLQQIPLIVMR